MSRLRRCMGSIADGFEFPRLRQSLVIQEFIGIHYTRLVLGMLLK